MIDRVGDARAQSVLRVHDTIVRECLRQHAGTERKHTGDGVIASFRSASTAVQCAVAIQQRLAEHNLEHPSARLRVRIGLNAGEPVAEEGELIGAAVKAAFAVCAQARPGRILVADVVRQLMAGKGFTFVARGHVTVKGQAQRVRLYEIQCEN